MNPRQVLRGSQKKGGPKKTGGRSASPRGEPAKKKKAPRPTRRLGAPLSSGWHASWRILWRVLGGSLVALFASMVLLFLWTTKSPSNDAQGNVHLAIESSHPDAIAAALEREGLVESAWLMGCALRVFSLGDSVLPRVHVLARGSSPRQLMAQLFERRQRPRFPVVLVEGWNLWQVAENLQEKGICQKAAFLSAATDPILLAKLSVPSSSAEGYLFPATYPMQLNTPPERVLRRLVGEARRRIESTLRRTTLDEDVVRLGLSHHELVILASLVEKETGREGERGRIARVFVNRMLTPTVTGGRLQSDPTARYGCRLMPQLSSCADFQKGVTPAMLKDADNPYNTYRNPGLPPGPIASPGEAALQAALRPAPGQDFFFVANGEGGHVFSSSFEEHRAAVAQLRAKRGSSF